jgi:hypothetical protein
MMPGLICCDGRSNSHSHLVRHLRGEMKMNVDPGACCDA